MKKALNSSVIFWFITTLVGQWIFAAYVAIYHGSLLVKKGLRGMDETHMPNGYIEGDNTGNIILAVHLITAIVIIGGGPLQFIPWIRTRFPVFHRYLGRFYVLFVFLGAMGGVYLIWTRPIPSFGSIYQNIAVSIEASLIVIFSVLTLKNAMARNIKIHRHWALRLFIVGSGVWFLRICYNAWFFIESLLGIEWKYAFDFWTFGSFLIPLAILEMYITSEKKKSIKITTATTIFVSTIFMMIGIYLVTKNMWIPKIQGIL